MSNLNNGAGFEVAPTTNRLAVDLSTRGVLHIQNMARMDFDRMPGVEREVKNEADKQFLYSAPAQYWSKTFVLTGKQKIEVVCFTNEPPIPNGGIYFGAMRFSSTPAEESR